jgi:hypothetical protein
VRSYLSWIAFLLLLALAASAGRPLIGGAPEKPAQAGLHIVQHGSYPELRVDGQPFFIHSAAFFYSRIPRGLWSYSLDRYRELGINTIDLYIIWNWHEPREGELDFDGHTNPRRDLRGLLKLIAGKGFKLVARPGPTILNEWRHGGYPEWLLERPEYGMPLLDRLEGRYPPLAGVNARHAEEAARGWLQNATHMAHARKWLSAVAHELAPYRASVSISTGQGKDQRDISGPLLIVQLEDDQAIGRTNYAGPVFWRYMDELCGMLEQSGLDAPCFINPEDMRVSAAGSALARPIGAMGQWYLSPPTGNSSADQTITASDASTIEFFVDTLKTQPAFPPVIIEYQAAWYAPGDDLRPPNSPPDNTLLSSRLLLAHGAHGLNHFPLQDTLFPAGYETPWTNRHYRWDAALTLNGFRQPRAAAVERTGQLLDTWGAFLASSHKRADFGLVYPLGSYEQEKLTRGDIEQVSGAVMRLERLAQLAGLSAELLDPEYQPVEQLLRHAVLLLPVADPASEKFQMSARSQRALVEYVRKGGMLVCLPVAPSGEILAELWKARPAAPHVLPSGVSAWSFGQGQVVEATKDIYSWVALEEDFAANRAQFEADFAVATLRGFLIHAGVRPAVRRVRSTREATALVLTQLVSNQGTEPLGKRSAGRGLLSATNLDYTAAAEEELEILPPGEGAKFLGGQMLALRLTVPPHESLLLPLSFSLCSAAAPGSACDDEVVLAGAELIRSERDGKTLDLIFYAPARATVTLRLRERPTRISLDDNRREANWTPERNLLSVEISRGAAPNFLRVLHVKLPYVPGVPARPEPPRGRQSAGKLINYSAVGALRLPLGEDSSLLSDPPLFALQEGHNVEIVIAAENLDDSRHDVEVRLEGPLSGVGATGVPAHEFRTVPLKLKTERVQELAAAPRGANGLLKEELSVSANGERSQSPVYFAYIPRSGAVGYRFDFDRDGNDEWVLENAGLRLIVSPESGGRAVALVEKTTGVDLATTIGLLADHFAFTPNPSGGNPARARGRFGMFNRAYRASWVSAENGPALRLDYHAPDVFPSGAEIAKTVHLEGQNHFAVEYSVVLAPVGGVPPPAGKTAQSFVAVNSIPARAAGERSTKLCWQQEAKGGADSKANAEHCEAFVPGGGALALPSGVSRLEIRTPGRAGVALDWNGARMTVERKNYSVLLRLEFPTLEPGGAAGRYRVGFSVIPLE